MVRTLAVFVLSLFSVALVPATMAGPIPLTTSTVSYPSSPSDAAAPTPAFTFGTRSFADVASAAARKPIANFSLSLFSGPGGLPHPSPPAKAAPSSSGLVLEMDWLS